MGVKTHDHVDRFFKSNIDRQKTFKQQQRYFLILAYRGIDELRTKPKRVTHGSWYILQTAITKGWTGRVNEITKIIDLKD